MNEEFDEIRKLGQENRREIEKAAYKNLVESGEMWLRINGEQALRNEIMQLKADLIAWNKITGSSLLLNIQAIDLILQTLSSTQTVMGNNIMEITTKFPRFYDKACKISAIRNYLIKERDEKIRQSNPGLSTP